MDYKSEYIRWKNKAGQDAELEAELAMIESNEAEINDRFCKHLEFGTGGLRAIMGAGTNRMNYYTVGRATQGLAAYLLGRKPSPVVCIAYDTRLKSNEFALAAARVLCANGITVYMFESARPTPMLSFAVRHKSACAGIVITASHNPREYNGYKVYGNDGGQITDGAAAEISNYIQNYDVFGFKIISEADAFSKNLLIKTGEDIDAPYYEQVKGLIIRKNLVKSCAGELKILYTPLHGSGNLPVRRVLRELGFSRVDTVKEQEFPDGTFPTLRTPNPEDPDVFRLAAQQAESGSYDLICATDPDCDRIGVLVRNETGDFSVLTGNQTGALLCDYIIRAKAEAGELPVNAAVVKTIVTTDLVESICKAHNIAIVNTLTGFKYIGEQVGNWEKTGDRTFLFGLEESYGYLAGTFVRDKDAVIAAALIAEMTLYYKKTGLTLPQALDGLYKRYGYCGEKLLSVTVNGIDGQNRIKEIMAALRNGQKDISEFGSPAFVEDYKNSVRLDCIQGGREEIHLPESNVLKLIFDDKSWLVVRPSGTEPKVKLYLSATGADEKSVRRRLDELEKMAAIIISDYTKHH